MSEQISNTPMQAPTPSSPPVKLWTPGFIAGVTFLLGFPAGIVIACINWMRMKMNDKAVLHLFIGAAGTVVFTIILILLPSTPGRVLGLLGNLGVLYYLRQGMKKDLENFKLSNSVEDAGQLGGCLIGLGTLVLLFILVFGLAFILALLGIPTPD